MCLYNCDVCGRWRWAGGRAGAGNQPRRLHHICVSSRKGCKGQGRPIPSGEVLLLGSDQHFSVVALSETREKVEIRCFWMLFLHTLWWVSPACQQHSQEDHLQIPGALDATLDSPTEKVTASFSLSLNYPRWEQKTIEIESTLDWRSNVFLSQ